MTDQTDAPAEAGASDWAAASAEIFGGSKAEPTPPEAAEAAPEPTEEPQPAPTEETPEPAAEADIWADAPEPLRTAYQKQQDDFAKLQQKQRSEDGRVAALNRELRQLREASSKPTRQEPEPADDDETDPFAKALSGLNGIKDDYPDLADPIIAAIGQLAERTQRLSAVHEDSEARAAASIQTQIEAEHPDWRAVIVGDDEAASFKAWVDDQPRRLRDIHAANWNGWANAQDTIELLNAYKQSLGTGGPPPAAPPRGAPETRPDPRRQRQLASAATAPSSGRPGVPEPEPKGGTALWNKATKEIFAKH